MLHQGTDKRNQIEMARTGAGEQGSPGCPVLAHDPKSQEGPTSEDLVGKRALEQSRAAKIDPRPISSGPDLAAKKRGCVVPPNDRDPAGKYWR
jgi:hypothetical protein